MECDAARTLHSVPPCMLQDGLFLLSQEPELIKGYEKAILTPNYVELQRLHKAVLKEEISNVEPIENVVSRLALKLGNVTLVLKGEHDVISNGRDGEQFCFVVYMCMHVCMCSIEKVSENSELPLNSTCQRHVLRLECFEGWGEVANSNGWCIRALVFNVTHTAWTPVHFPVGCRDQQQLLIGADSLGSLR